jgi:uncharacterized protein (DUF697 family)
VRIVRLPWTPRALRGIANFSFSKLVIAEVARSRHRIAELTRVYPSAGREELARRLVDSKKATASTAGAVSGFFGLASVPLDLVLVTVLQISLLVDMAVLHGVSLKSARAQDELLDVLGFANGIGPLVRAGPKVVGRIAVAIFERGGLPGLGRAVPVVASPITAWLNSRAIKRVGREGMRFYSREERRQKSSEQA